ncbi:MAG TPA: cytochrome c [Bacteroidota bacterium]
MKPVLWTILVILVVGVVGALFVAYSGIITVAARSPRGGPLEWFLNTTSDHSVAAHAKGITVPSLNDSSQIAAGFDDYREMCIFCHGSPAGGQSEAGMGLNPPAPELSEAARDWSPAELYWIVKNGVKMTGMPSFASTHSEQELWAIVAFLEKLKRMDPAQYKAFVAAKAGPGETAREERGGQNPQKHHVGD